MLVNPAPADSPLSDEALMAALVDGQDAALGELMHRWEVPLRVFLKRMVFSETQAEELAQETFVRLYEKRAHYRKGASFKSWLLTLGGNLARNHLRWRACRKILLPLSEADALADEDASFKAEGDDVAERVKHAIARLPVQLREVLVLSVYEELTQEEIAEVVGCTRKAVETRLKRARDKLRLWL